MIKEGQAELGYPFNIVGLLKSCITLRDLHKGFKLHEYIQMHKCLGENTYIGSILVSMYAKCGALAKAQQVLEELPVRDVVSWSALITGYTKNGQGEEALKCYDDMLQEGHIPDAVTFACILKACGSIRDAAKGKGIHDKVVSLGMLGKDIVLGNSLVDMYAKCGALVQAEQVLRGLPVRDVVSWNALTAGYAQRNQGEEALKCFEDMLCEGHSPTAVTFICVLKACESIGAVAKGQKIHDWIVSLGMLEKHSALGNLLVDMYVKCGALSKAHQLLEELPVRDVVSWSTLLAGYAEQGQGEEALKCFDVMLCEGLSPTAVSFISVLKACGSIRAAVKGKEIHDKIVNLGMLVKDIVLGNALVDMYVKCSALAQAHEVHEELPARDIISWNALIAGYAEQGQGSVALKCFDDMLREGHCPTAATFICVLKACGTIAAAATGEEIHGKIMSLCMLQKHIVIGFSLVDMYVKCNELVKAHQVHEGLPIHHVVSWSALIGGYAEEGQGEEALKCFDNMLNEGHSPDVGCFKCALKACGSIGVAAKGKEIHDKIISLGIIEKDIVLGNSVVAMYVKCGALDKAHWLHKELPVRDVVSWNVLMAGYAQQGQGEEALNIFNDMLCEGHSPTMVTFICILKACGSIGTAAKGEEIRANIINLGKLEKDVVLGTSLVDMYMKCGALGEAQQVLKELPLCDALSWSALMSGYAQQGQSVETINCFEMMLSNGVKPNLSSLNVALNACSHSGLLDQAECYFSGMSSRYGFHPSLEHYCCMTGVFSRAGKFNKALSVIAGMPYINCLPSWVALLGACRKWAEVRIGRLAFKHALHSDKSDSIIYVLMADTYRAAGIQEEAHKVEEMRVSNMTWKGPGGC